MVERRFRDGCRSVWGISMSCAEDYEYKRETKDTKFDMYIGSFSAIVTAGMALCIYGFGFWEISILCILPILVFTSVAYHSWKWLKKGEGNDKMRQVR